MLSAYSVRVNKVVYRWIRLLFSIWCLLVAPSNDWHRSQRNFPQRSAVFLRGMCWLTAAQAGLPALGQQSLPVPLTPCSTTTITQLQTLCQDTVVTQPWASVPPLSTRLMDADRTKEEDKRTHWYLKLLKLKVWWIIFWWGWDQLRRWVEEESVLLIYFHISKLIDFFLLLNCLSKVHHYPAPLRIFIKEKKLYLDQQDNEFPLNRPTADVTSYLK